MSAEVADVLREALALIEDEKDWCGGDRGNWGLLYEGGVVVARCTAHALNTATGTKYDLGEAARKAVVRALGLTYDYIPQWNDAPERTHAEVVAAFKDAIVAEEWSE